MRAKKLAAIGLLFMLCSALSVFAQAPPAHDSAKILDAMVVASKPGGGVYHSYSAKIEFDATRSGGPNTITVWFAEPLRDANDNVVKDANGDIQYNNNNLGMRIFGAGSNPPVSAITSGSWVTWGEGWSGPYPYAPRRHAQLIVSYNNPNRVEITGYTVPTLSK